MKQYIPWSKVGSFLLPLAANYPYNDTLAKSESDCNYHKYCRAPAQTLATSQNIPGIIKETIKTMIRMRSRVDVIFISFL